MSASRSGTIAHAHSTARLQPHAQSVNALCRGPPAWESKPNRNKNKTYPHGKVPFLYCQVGAVAPKDAPQSPLAADRTRRVTARTQGMSVALDTGRKSIFNQWADRRLIPARDAQERQDHGKRSLLNHYRRHISVGPITRIRNNNCTFFWGGTAPCSWLRGGA